MRKKARGSKTETKPRKGHLEIKNIRTRDLYFDTGSSPAAARAQAFVRTGSCALQPRCLSIAGPQITGSATSIPILATIMPIKEFDFNALEGSTSPPPRTTRSSSIAAEQEGKKYAGSTSSMTSMLAHFHYLLSAWRPVNIEHADAQFPGPDSVNFTRINRAPAATFLHYKDGTYAIDADKEFDSANILSMLGKSMEKLLTLPKEEYEKYRRINSDQITEEQRNEPEAYHYTTMGDFMMRSQLDAYDPRVSGSGMFDLKTRAVVSIRMDARDFHKGLGYEIRSRFGQWQSYEREYYDMIRSAFLKYSLQVRMGRMDGIFVAFPNTQRIFRLPIHQPGRDGPRSPRV